MRAFVRFGTLALALVVALAPAGARAQEPAKPGPEHELLKKMEGSWDIVMKAGGMEMKGTVSGKMDLGGLWLTTALKCDFGGTPFEGRGMDTYDAAKKKYVSVWIDSMGTQPMIMEGTYDKEKNVLTMAGDGPGMDGKPAKWKSLTKFVNDKTFNFEMFVGDAKEPMFTIVYKKK
jgi:hypothetical protein